MITVLQTWRKWLSDIGVENLTLHGIGRETFEEVAEAFLELFLTQSLWKVFLQCSKVNVVSFLSTVEAGKSCLKVTFFLSHYLLPPACLGSWGIWSQNVTLRWAIWTLFLLQRIGILPSENSKCLIPGDLARGLTLGADPGGLLWGLTQGAYPAGNLKVSNLTIHYMYSKLSCFWLYVINTMILFGMMLTL